MDRAVISMTGFRYVVMQAFASHVIHGCILCDASIKFCEFMIDSRDFQYDAVQNQFSNT